MRIDKVTKAIGILSMHSHNDNAREVKHAEIGTLGEGGGWVVHVALNLDFDGDDHGSDSPAE